MDGRLLVAHSPGSGQPPEDLPYVPDVLYLRQGQRYWRLDRDGESDVGVPGYQHALQSGTAETDPIPWEPGSWAIVEKGHVKLFPKASEEEVRAARARELVASAPTVRGDPEKVLSMLRAAGALVRVPVDNLVSKLESARASRDESLVEIFQRVRKSG